MNEKKMRVHAILQLCLAFTLLAWCFGYPFMGELFSYRARILVYQDQMGVIKGGSNITEAARLMRNAERFKKLPTVQQERIRDSYERIQSQSEKPFLQKLGMAFYIVLFELSLFEKAWIAMAIVVSILLLMRAEGAWQAAWLLPVLALCYAWDNHTHGLTPLETAEYRLYPSEQLIKEHYLTEAWSHNIFDQQRQLKQGWENYLVIEWAQQQPNEESSLFAEQVEEGAYAFNTAKLEAMQFDPAQHMAYFFRKKLSWFLLAAYFVWNLYFIWAVKPSKRLVYV